MSDAKDVLVSIRRFNRKERFFLIGYALDQVQDETIRDGLQVGSDFADALSKAAEVKVPRSAIWTMDYHMDWLYAALVFARGDKHLPPSPFLDADRRPYNLNTNQEDLDLLVAFEWRGEAHLLLVEAKGYTSWGVRQLRSKASRLGFIFPGPGRQGGYGVFPGLPVKARFVLASLRGSPGLNKWVHSQEGRGVVPRWMLAADGSLRHLPLPLPPASQRLKPKRRQSLTGEPTWQIVAGND